MPPTVAAPPEQLVRRLYDALADGDRTTLETLLHPDFEATLAAGMPFGIGGTRHGVAAAWDEGWGAIGRHFAVRATPERFLPLTDGRLLVLGRYVGKGRRGGGGAVDASFAHLIAFDSDRVRSLEQHTDTARWAGAAPPFSTLRLRVADGIAAVTLDRPRNGNAIDVAMARDLKELATRLAEDPSVRVVLLGGNGPMFTAGGDIDLFTKTPAAQLPAILRRMIDDYHLALERLVELDAPIVAAVKGAAAGGGLGMVCAADVVVAAEEAVFTVGYGRLGLTADGGNTWFLPRLVGMRRAQEMFLRGRRLTAAEALDWGIVSTVVPTADVDAEARRIAVEIAAGPTSAFGGVRTLLRQSFETGLRDQLAAEKTAIVEVSATADAQEGIAAFGERRRPRFTGR